MQIRVTGETTDKDKNTQKGEQAPLKNKPAHFACVRLNWLNLTI